MVQSLDTYGFYPNIKLIDGTPLEGWAEEPYLCSKLQALIEVLEQYAFALPEVADVRQ